MIKRRIILAIITVVLFASCTGKASLKDGYYTAEAREFDIEGWKEYVTICVTAGKIIHIEYNAVNPSGFVKSWDMDYMRCMNAAMGTYPNAYTRYYAAQALKMQGTDGIDCLTGATNSYNSFRALTDAAIINSQQGVSETKLVDFQQNRASVPTIQ